MPDVTISGSILEYAIFLAVLVVFTAVVQLIVEELYQKKRHFLGTMCLYVLLRAFYLVVERLGVW